MTQNQQAYRVAAVAKQLVEDFSEMVARTEARGEASSLDPFSAMHLFTDFAAGVLGEVDPVSGVRLRAIAETLSGDPSDLDLRLAVEEVGATLKKLSQSASSTPSA
jgi:hypothetical protein